MWFFHRIRNWTRGKHLWLRNNLSTMTSQALDPVLYSFVVWWGVVELGTAVQLALAKYVFKVFIAICDTPFIYWARGWTVPELEGDAPRAGDPAAADNRSAHDYESVAQ